MATRGGADLTAVEGRDPDGLVVVLVHLGPEQAPLTRLPTRIYAW